MVSKDLGPEVSEVEITDLTATSRPRYCFRDPTGKHWLWISAMSRPFQRAVIDPTLAITPRFAVQLNRRSLWLDANLLGRDAEERRLVCAVLNDETGAHKFHVRANSTQPSPNWGVLDSTLHVAAESSFAGWTFSVLARDLIVALVHFSAKEILLVSRPVAQGSSVPGQPDHGWGWLEIRPATDASDAAWTTPGPQAFLRIMPPPLPSVVDQQAVAGPVQAVSVPATPGAIQAAPAQSKRPRRPVCYRKK